jgi:hypothetical protein
MKPVDPRTPLRIVEVSAEDGVDHEAIAELAERAFRRNYQGKLRVVCDVDYYERLLGGGDWIGTLALDQASGAPVGCYFALLRSLCRKGETFPASYSTSWVVDPAYRRTGASLLIWKTLNAALRERRCITLGAAHGGNSGTRAGTVFRNAPADRRVSVIAASGAIWSRSLGGMPARSRTAAAKMQRLCFVDGPEAYEDPDAPVTRSAYESMLSSRDLLCFAPTGNFARTYFNSEEDRSGTLWLQFEGGACCAVGYSMFALALDDVPIGQTGRIQFFQSFGCDEDQQAVALDEVCGFLARAGCSSASLLDQRTIGVAALTRCGFVETQDAVTISFGVEPSLADRFEECSPSALDFI